MSESPKIDVNCTLLFKSLESVHFFFKETNTFIQQGCVELKKSANKDINNVI